jgi:hypothetical protein
MFVSRLDLLANFWFVFRVRGYGGKKCDVENGFSGFKGFVYARKR